MKKQTFKHIRQQDASDCGVACLKMVLQHFKSDASFERLRELSGTTLTGTSMLGLVQAGQHLGLDTEGFEADMPSLKKCKEVCILHVLTENQMQHYVVYYGYDTLKKHYIVSDPAQPITQYLTEEQLDKIWQSKSLLVIKPTEKLVPLSIRTQNQRIWFWQFVKEDKDLLIVAAILGILTAILGLSTAIFSQKLIDKILPDHDVVKLYAGIGLLLVLLLLRMGLGYIRQLFLLRQSHDFNIRLIDYFYSSLLHLPKSFFDHRKTGELIARMNDTSRIQQTVSAIVGNVVIDFLLIIVALVATFSYDWRVGLAALAWLPIFGGIVWYFHNRIVVGQRAVMAAYAANESNYVDTIQGVADIKMTNRQPFFQNLTKSVYSFFQGKMVDLGKIGALFNAVNDIASSLFIVTLLLIAALLVLRGSLSIGGMMAILQMVGTLMASAGRLALTNIQLQEAKIAFERMREFTTVKPEFDLEEDRHKAVISDFEELKIDNLAFRFAGRKRLLDDVSFSLRKGEMIALLGESGCGKSTTIRILQKFYAAESGKIKVNGLDFDLISTQNWRSIIGVVPQQIKLFNGSLLDNILLGDTENDSQKITDFFNKHGFSLYFEQFPNGYATVLGENGVNISGGQMQLVGLARALWQQPKLLILDEPTAALDRDTEGFVIQLLDRLKSDTAILLLTHRISIARNAERIYILKNGQIEQSGNHKRLLETENLYARAWRDMAIAV